MALFARKKEEEKKVASAKKPEAPKSAPAMKVDEKASVKPAQAKKKNSKGLSSNSIELERVLKHPRITEKATMATGSGIYVFDVDARANKKLVAAAIEHVYNVSPKKVRIAPVPYKRVSSRRRGIFGVSGGGKKA